MRKSGFTLAELLITLGITGIIAALLAGTVSKLMPDKTKIMYLKAHNELTNDIKSLASDSALFPSTMEINGTEYDVSKYPLLNLSRPLKARFNRDDYTNNKKLCNLIAFTMNATNPSCGDSGFEYSDQNFDSHKSFTTQNGFEWWIVPTAYQIENGRASYQTDVYVDVNPKGKNCLYSSICKHPDRFKFIIASDGSVIPADPMGRKYIETQKSWTKKNYDTNGNILASLDDNLLSRNLEEAHIATDSSAGNNDNPNNNNNDEHSENDIYAVCGENYDYGDVWVEYTPYPIADNTFIRKDSRYSYYADHKHPIDFKVKLSKPISKDYFAYLRFWNDTIVLDRITCTVKAGETECTGEDIDNSKDLNTLYNLDTIYTFDNVIPDGNSFTYFYNNKYLNLNIGFMPSLEVFARDHWAELENNSNQKCIHINKK